MAERYNTYYRATWHINGMIGPVLTKKQLMNEIEVSLLNLGIQSNEMAISIAKYKMTKKQFKNRPYEQKNYCYQGSMH
jgi:hypothetical protein